MRRTTMAFVLALSACDGPRVATPTGRGEGVGGGGERVRGEESSERDPAPAVTPTDAGVVDAADASLEVVRIDESNTDQRIRVRVGAPFRVELVGVPTAGYEWLPAELPGFLTRTGSTTEPTTSAQTQPGFVGGSHRIIQTFVATMIGEGTLELNHRRRWEPPTAANRTVRFVIVAW